MLKLITFLNLIHFATYNDTLDKFNFTNNMSMTFKIKKNFAHNYIII